MATLRKFFESNERSLPYTISKREYICCASGCPEMQGTVCILCFSFTRIDYSLNPCNSFLFDFDQVLKPFSDLAQDLRTSYFVNQVEWRCQRSFCLIPHPEQVLKYRFPIFNFLSLQESLFARFTIILPSNCS